MNLGKSFAITLAVAAITAAAFVPTAVIASEAPVQEIEQSFTDKGQTTFPVGKDNVAYEKYFTGNSYLHPMASGEGIGVANVTFAPGTINHWHIHKGSCQILVGLAGVGYYQIWGEAPQKMIPGMTVTIPEGVKHWHGAANGSWFQHLAIMKDGAGTEWLEPVDEAEYAKLE